MGCHPINTTRKGDKVKITDCISTYWSALILKTLKAENEWTEKVKKDKELTKKQKDDAIMIMHGIGILEGEIFIEGCKHGAYTLQYLPDGSVIQRFIKQGGD